MVNVTVRPTLALNGEICAPASKAYTQRMVVAAALSTGNSKISGPLESEDSQATVRAITALGAKIRAEGDCWTVEGTAPIHGASKPIDCGESGATLRFMIPVAALAATQSVFVLGKGLANRPLEPLLNSLRQLGAKAEFRKRSNGEAHVHVEGGGILGGKARLPGDVSSQFVSGLMFACPLANGDTELMLTSPLESQSYVQMTQEVLSRHGVNVEISKDYRKVKIHGGQSYRTVDGKVPGDFSSAAFLLAAAAITKSDVTVRNLDRTTAQGDKAILSILKEMGVQGKVCADSVEIWGDGEPLSPTDVDARDIPDLVPVCAALACHSKGKSRIHNAQRVRWKESDRLASMYAELRNMGADVRADENSLTINGPCSLHGTVIDPFSDHRVAMACAVAALRAEGETVIADAECVRKSYPQFFNDLRKIGADVVGGEFDR